MFMNDITHILEQIEQGDISGSDRLLPLVYYELRRLEARRLDGWRVKYPIIHFGHTSRRSPFRRLNWQAKAMINRLGYGAAIQIGNHSE